MIGKIISHYKIIEKLGEGGMGIVYKAEDTNLNRFVALKFLPVNLSESPEDIARFQQEAMAISALNHPNIAILYDLDETEGNKFLVMEYISGGTLKGKIKVLLAEGRYLPIAKILEYGLQIAEGLGHAHRHGIIHRDIKTDNMMLTEEGIVKITDFGVAKFHGSTEITKVGTTIGTAAYMSPEQIFGVEQDFRSDLFSYGIVLYELATGKLPFRGEHEAALGYSIVNEDPIPIVSVRPEIPSFVQDIIYRCLEKDKAKRYQKAEEIATNLRQVQQEITVALSGKSRKFTFSKILHKKKYLRRINVITFIMTVILILAGRFTWYEFISSKFTSYDKKSIAVLPFKNLSEDKENEYFSDGITEDIITQLSKIGDLKVISRTSVMQYKNKDKKLRDLAKELHVGSILEGSVRRSENQVRIVAQLIDANTDNHLWGETYDKEFTQIFAIQTDVARQIAAALKAKLSSNEQEQIEKSPTKNLTAYEYYLKGREYYYLYHKEGNENAIRLFKKALEVDPEYALAYAGLADAFAQKTLRYNFESSWLDSAIEQSNRALAIDPKLPEAYKALGLVYYTKSWFYKSIEANRKALEFNPNYAPAIGNIGWTYYYLGDIDQSYSWIKRALQLNPTNPTLTLGLGMVYLNLEKDKKAEEWLYNTLNLQPKYTPNPMIGIVMIHLIDSNYSLAKEKAKQTVSLVPDEASSRIVAGDVELFSENYGEAYADYEKARAIDPEGWHPFTGINITTSLGYINWKKNHIQEAQKMFFLSQKLDEKNLAEESNWWGLAYDIAAIQAIQGNKEEAYRWLEKAIDSGWRNYRLTMIDPLFENLRNDEPFKQMMEKVKTKVDEMKKRVQQLEVEGAQ